MTKSNTKLNERRKKQITAKAEERAVKIAKAETKEGKTKRNDTRAGKIGRGSKKAEVRRKNQRQTKEIAGGIRRRTYPSDLLPFLASRKAKGTPWARVSTVLITPGETPA